MNKINQWIRCENPNEWICDFCDKCGGECCQGAGKTIKMWHQNDDKAVCEYCKNQIGRI